jgi:hypothetical protein
MIYKKSVRTSQETHYISATEPNRLMLFRETVAVCYENRTEHTDTLCMQCFSLLKHVVYIVTTWFQGVEMLMDVKDETVVTSFR